MGVFCRVAFGNRYPSHVCIDGSGVAVVDLATATVLLGMGIRYRCWVCIVRAVIFGGGFWLVLG